MQADNFEKPIVTADVVLLTIVDRRLHVALARRKVPPFEGEEALIGGFVHVDEDKDVDETVARVLMAKTGLKKIYFEQLASFAGRLRDPRGWSVSIAYMALVPAVRLVDSTALMLRPVDEVRGLPFDHSDILDAAVGRLRGKGAYSTLPMQLLDRKFTLPALQEVYEQVMGVNLDTSSFRRKIAELEVVEATDEFEAPAPRKRPGRLYRAKRGVLMFDRTI